MYISEKNQKKKKEKKFWIHKQEKQTVDNFVKENFYIV